MVLDNKKLFVTLLLMLFVGLGYAQEDAKRYFVYLKDKTDTPYSISKPEQFLSQKAIERRKKQGIKITSHDLPINPTYIKKIKETGAKVWYASKWLNALLIESNESILAKVKVLPFVKPDIEIVHPEAAKISPKPENTDAVFAPETAQPLSIEEESDYGRALNQIKMIGAEEMHKAGYKGQGMVIAVFDSGFLNAHKLSYFKHLFAYQRILGTYNFVDNHEYVYGTGDHGTKVLSTIAAYKKGEIIGSAPEASFYLFRTEDASTEYRVEEVNWLIAAEKADSLGVDVINSSLGYTTFDDSTMNYTFESLDGNTALITRAADFAAQKGILVVNSAGNEGGNEWQYVGTPADADSILSIGAVNSVGKYAYFSSKGYTANKRIKPNLSAQGLGTVVVAPNDRVSTASGTSFSSPLTAGFVTSFWQANPSLSNMEVIKYLQATASQAEKPDSLLGYGIPNFAKAHALVQSEKGKNNQGVKEMEEKQNDKILVATENSKGYRISLGEEYRNKKLRLVITDSQGKVVQKQKFKTAESAYSFLLNVEETAKGIYYLSITGKKLSPIKLEFTF